MLNYTLMSKNLKCARSISVRDVNVLGYLSSDKQRIIFYFILHK